ncbi:hypothetical protein DIURU_003832 [Diutina rugosa]|uniref:Protein BIG1 n=1 Tax=Diutina rugosa TaxID=5481 RepID=A0A642URJ0_DIURU|nr:uncharacterized protein DIURU_003832 [Diutina rugosa]KAA8900409.1 hypothetical protein DIURU_003832 [Diutina rugosa]
MLQLRKVVTILGLITVAYAYLAVPVLYASHKLVPGLWDEIGRDWSSAYSGQDVTNMVRKAITPCSSDEYLIVNMPGLTQEDMNDRSEWPFLERYLHMASTVVGAPWVRDPLDIEYLESYIIQQCEAETIVVSNMRDEEVPQYLDTRTRVIRVEYEELDAEDLDHRHEQLRDADELIRKILRKLPSPHYSIIVTSDTPVNVHPIPAHITEENPDIYGIFNKIINDPKREEEVERNDRFHKAEPDWIESKHSNERYLRNRRDDEVHFFDYDLWTKNDKVVMTIFLMVSTLGLMKLRSMFNHLIYRQKGVDLTRPSKTRKKE